MYSMPINLTTNIVLALNSLLMRLGETDIEFRNPERAELHIIEVHIHPKYQTGTTHYNVGIAVAGLILVPLI